MEHFFNGCAAFFVCFLAVVVAYILAIGIVALHQKLGEISDRLEGKGRN